MLLELLTNLFKEQYFLFKCETQHVYAKQKIRRCSSPYCFKSTLHETIIRLLHYYKRFENKILLSENYTKPMGFFNIYSGLIYPYIWHKWK